MTAGIGGSPITLAAIGIAPNAKALFGVSAYGPDLGLRITEGLGLVVVT